MEHEFSTKHKLCGECDEATLVMFVCVAMTARMPPRPEMEWTIVWGEFSRAENFPFRITLGHKMHTSHNTWTNVHFLFRNNLFDFPLVGSFRSSLSRPQWHNGMYLFHVCSHDMTQLRVSHREGNWFPVYRACCAVLVDDLPKDYIIVVSFKCTGRVTAVH